MALTTTHACTHTHTHTHTVFPPLGPDPNQRYHRLPPSEAEGLQQEVCCTSSHTLPSVVVALPAPLPSPPVWTHLMLPCCPPSLTTHPPQQVGNTLTRSDEHCAKWFTVEAFVCDAVQCIHESPSHPTPPLTHYPPTPDLSGPQVSFSVISLQKLPGQVKRKMQDQASLHHTLRCCVW